MFYKKFKKWLFYKILRAMLWHYQSLIKKIKTIIIDHYGDKKLGIDTDDFVEFKNIPESFQTGVYKDGRIFASTGYQELGRLADYLKLAANDVFIDFGCGKGRVVFFIANNKLKKVIGVEIKKELVEIALQNKALLNPITPVEIIHEDAAKVDVHEGTVFFFYNPFGLMTFSKVLSNIKESFKSHPRNIRIIYYNILYASLLDSHDWLERETTIENGWGMIWRNKADYNSA